MREHGPAYELYQQTAHDLAPRKIRQCEALPHLGENLRIAGNSPPHRQTPRSLHHGLEPSLIHCSGAATSGAVLNSAAPRHATPETHRQHPSRATAQDPAELQPQGLRYSLPNRTRSPAGHDRVATGSRALWFRIEPPLEHVPFDNQRSRNTALYRALALRTNVDQHRPGRSATAS